jgi:hypothetical protein
MSATRKKLSRPSHPANSQTALMSWDADISSGSEKLRPESLLSRERPAKVQEAFKRARVWGKENWFVGEVLRLKTSFYNYGCRLTSLEKGKHSKVADFLTQEPAVKAEIERYIREVWREWLLLQNVVAFWRQENDTPVILLSPEDCKYTDAFGYPKLEANLGYDKKDAPPGTEKKVLDRYYSGKPVVMTRETQDEFDEYFDVLTTQRRGKGFSHPNLYAIFHTLSQTESMEIGEQMLALAGRRVLHRHKLGFEQRGSNPSRFQQNFSVYKKKRADAIISFVNGRFGFQDTVQNFDHAIEVFLGDGGPKSYDGRKWDSPIRRLMWWGGPLGFMMVANSMNPFLLPMLKTTANEERAEVSRHLNLVLNAAFDLPVPVQVTWSNRCFIDARLAWDMVNALLKQGPLSGTTAIQEADLCPEHEVENKRKEAANEDDYLPIVPEPPPGKPGGDTGKAGPKTKKDASATKPSGQTSGARGK